MLEAGNRVGRYEVQRRLGRGGMGTVYVAQDPVLGRLVAIKVFHGDLDLPDARDRFIREARHAAALNHANIVTIHDFGEFSSQPYIVMEHIAGETLADVIRAKSGIAIVEKLRWLEDLCAGVAYAHEIGVLHRDIKPANLMIDRSHRLKILDFGVARMVGTSGKATALIGTPGYMAPEQILGSNVDARSDVFSVGVVAYELLSYTEAFPGETLPTISHRVLHEEPAPLAEVVQDIHPDLAAAVTRALQKSTDDRYPDATSLRQAFGRVRRHMELYGGSDSAALRLSRISSLGDVGTGGGRQRAGSGGGVAQATPPPDPRRNTPVQPATAASRIATALARARGFLDAGHLDSALDACEQALAIDSSNADALAIEQAIRAAAARRHARALLEDAARCIAAGSLPEAQELIEQARWLDPELDECAQVERDLHAARLVHDQRPRELAQQHPQGVASDETVILPPRTTPRPVPVSDQGATLIIPRRLTPPPDPALRPSSSRGLTGPPVNERPASSPGEGPASSPGEVGVGRPPSSRGVGAAPRAPSPTDSWANQTAVATTANPAARVTNRRVTSRASAARKVADWRQTGAQVFDRLRPWLRSTRALSVAAVVVVLAVGIAAVTLLRPATVPSGTLVLDAVPWAAVTAIKAADGREHEIPPGAGTPLTIALPVGRYTITLAGPPPDSGSRTLTVDVLAAGLTTAPVTRFQTITVDQYFEQYLQSSRGEAASGETQEAASQP